MQQQENTVDGESIYIDANGVFVSHNTSVETREGKFDLEAGCYYDVFAGDHTLPIQFQIGSINTCGVNGITSEALLSILIHRTNVLNNKFPCSENRRAISYMENALALFNQRTADQQTRGVEGLNTV